VASPFEHLEVDEELRPVARLFDFDLDDRLAAVVALEAHVSPDAYSARSLGQQRFGNATVVDEDGLLLTMGYLITEADEVELTTVDGRALQAHVLGVDAASGLGLIHALEPLRLPAMPLGDSRRLKPEAAVISAGGGGRSHALLGAVAARGPFAGYWEYFLEEALFVSPAHPHWSGAGLIGPNGDLVGVASLRMERMAEGGGEAEPLNMFVPVELVSSILGDLAAGRQTTPPRPWLGVFAEEVRHHVVVASVSPGGPAARAELRRGDVLHRIGGEAVRDLGSFYKRLWALGPPGVSVPLTVQRGADVFDMEIRSADRTSMQKRRRLN
jgi:S1-C subfamily serine protease